MTSTPHEDWLPGYPRQPIDAGLNWTPGTPWKVGLHSTESEEGSAGVIIAGWRKNPGSGLSHFIANRPDPSQFIQLLPFSVGAYTAQNPEGGIDTNRAHLIQIECCNYAINPAMGIAWPPKPISASNPARVDWSDAWYAAIAQWLRDLVANGIDIDLTVELSFPDHWTGYPGGAQAYLDSRAVLCHALIPEQPGKHWDVGLLDQPRLLREARGGAPIPPTPAPIPGDEPMSAAEVADLKKYIDGKFALDAQYHQDDRKVTVAGTELALSDNITEAGWSGREYFAAVAGSSDVYELVRYPTGAFLPGGAPRYDVGRIKVGTRDAAGNLDAHAAVIMKVGRNPHIVEFAGDEAAEFESFPVLNP